MKRLGLVPLRNFGHIDGLIYRSAQPIYPYEYRWIKEILGISMIINLRAESNLDHKKYTGINIYNIPVVDRKPPSIEQANEFMKLIEDAKEPVLIHCEHGHGRTSTFSVLAKIALGWDLEEAIGDERKRFHYKFKYHAQEDFLRNLEF